MHDGVFLHIGARADANFLVIAAQSRPEPDRRPLFKHDPPNEICIRRDPCIFGNFRALPVKFIHRH